MWYSRGRHELRRGFFTKHLGNTEKGYKRRKHHILPPPPLPPLLLHSTYSVLEHQSYHQFHSASRRHVATAPSLSFLNTWYCYSSHLVIIQLPCVYVSSFLPPFRASDPGINSGHSSPLPATFPLQQSISGQEWFLIGVLTPCRVLSFRFQHQKNILLCLLGL